MNKNILIITNKIFNLTDDAEENILEIEPGADVNTLYYKDVKEKDIKKAEIIFGWPRYRHLKIAENLKWLQLPSAGVDNYADKELYLNDDFLLTNASGVYGKPIAEHVIAMILSYNRNLTHYTLKKQENKWEKQYEVLDFFDSTVGIIGLGDIGSEVAKRASALGARIIGFKRHKSEKPDYIDQQFSSTGLEPLIKESDYIILALPATKETEGIIDENKLKMMKNSAFLVNIGRGELIEQKPLIRALKENWIAGAGLDVTNPEPLPENSELWDLENVILTQHSSGFSPTNDKRRFDIFYKNLSKYIQNKTLINLVDFELGY
jgi:phosphoglycerate dehydrogenase-like enzyme